MTTILVSFGVELHHEGEWLRWASVETEAAAREVLVTVQSEYPHKRARVLRRTTTEEEISLDGA